jgi:hypothetical protein
MSFACEYKGGRSIRMVSNVKITVLVPVEYLPVAAVEPASFQEC